MYTNNRDAYRLSFFNAWQKHLKKLPLEAVEAQLIDIMLLHPDYQRFLEKPDAFQSQEFALEENPFFHMSLHLAIREQINTDRPAGIKQIHQALLLRHSNPHEVEHLMMTCLAEMLWEAQQTGATPSEEVYLNKLREIE